MRRARTWAKRLLVIVALLVGVLGGTLATHTGQSALLSLISWLASDDEQAVAFGPIEGSLFSKGNIAGIRVADRAGEWLVVRNVSFDWQPLKLLAGRLHVRQIGAAGVDILRAPQGGSSASGSAGPPRLIPALLDRVEISEIAIGDSIIGAAARFKVTATAHFEDPGHGADARLEIERLDLPGGSLTADLNYRPDANRLTLSAHGKEAPGGLVAQIAGLPSSLPLSLDMQGDGPLDNWRGNFSLKASDSPFVAGAMAIDRVATGHAFSAQMHGFLDSIAPKVWRGLLSGKTAAQARGKRTASGLIVIEEAGISNDALRITGAGEYHPDKNELTGRAHLNIARADGLPVPLPVKGDTPSSIASLDVAIDLPAATTATAKPATLAISARSIVTAAGSAGQLDANGAITRTTNRLIDGPFKITATLQGLTHADAPIANAAGDKAAFSANGNISSAGQIELPNFALRMANASIEGRGTIEHGKFNGQLQAHAPDLGPFVKLAGIDASGGATLDAQGVVGLDAADLDVALNGTSPSLLLTEANGTRRDFGAMSLTFKASRDHGGPLSVREAQIISRSLKAHGHMTLADAKVDGEAHAELSDLAAMSRDAEGAATLSAKLSGTFQELQSTLLVEGHSIKVAGRSFANVVARLDGKGPIKNHAVQASIDAMVTGEPLAARSRIMIAPNTLAFENLTLDWGALAVRGSATLSGKASQGRIRIEHANLSQLKALAGVELAGRMKADIDIVPSESGSAARVRIVSSGVSAAGARLGKTEIAATIPLHDPLRHTTANVRADAVAFEKNAIGDVRIEITPHQDGLHAAMSAKAPNTEVVLAGQLKSLDDTIVVSLQDFQARRNGRTLKLSRPAAIRLSDGRATISGLSIQSGDGHLDIDGSLAASELDINARIAGLPADLTDMIDTSIGTEGRLNGTIRAKGSPSKPSIDFDTAWLGASARSVRDAGLPPIDLRARGNLADTVFSARFDATGYEGLSITSDVRSSGQGYNALSGTISGRAPLSLANAILAERGTRFTGAALVNAKLQGTLGKPKLDGEIRIDNASARDTETGTVIQQINGTARISETALEIVNIRGLGDKGGAVSVSGALSWSPTPPQFKGLTIALDRLKIDDKKQISGEVDGSLAINGPIDNMIAAGRIDLKRLDVLVPEQMPRSVAALDLKHVNAPGGIAQKTAPIDNARTQGGKTTVGLQIVIHALDRISVRGRGLDALLGGELKLRGTADVPVADGAFELVRGRLSLLGRQLDFQRGTVAFTGALEPYLDLEAGTEADGVTIAVTVSGPASRPEFKFSSQPDLPDDEILARLVFNKALVKLTPLQIAQLASEIDKIGGLSSGPGVLDKLKSTIGIDRLDMTTEKDGTTAVSAGSYVSDSTYVGVRQGLTAGSSRIVIDHDLTKNLKARGEIGADGNSKLGIGVEWEY